MPMLQAPIAIRANGLVKRFKETTALDQVSMNFEAGLMHGVIGPDGAGKTTLMRLVLGLMRPQSGELRFFRGDEPVDFEKIRPDIAYMPQQQSLYPDLSIEEHLAFFRELYCIPADRYRSKREELLEMTQLGKFTDRAAGKLSGGMYKKLGLMCALLRSPQAMVLDEPTNGVDPISRREFWDMLYRLSDQKVLILVTTAYMDEAERCARVHLLDGGRVIAEGEPRALLNREGVRSFDEFFIRRKAAVDA
jgi:ABC-2 type transport system ATP-binding protein